jgi:DNA-binding MarR family transcriptional regulator
MKPKDLPIGYWIRKADETLTNGINKIQLDFGFTRTDWQILNSLQESNGIYKAELLEIINSFAEKPIVENILSEFEKKNLVEEQSSKLKLTQKGLEIQQQCFERQKIFRNKSMEGISEHEYQSTYLTLKKLVNNIGTE